jgi:hypothetical protein
VFIIAEIAVIAHIARHRGKSIASMLQTPTNLAVRGEPADASFFNSGNSGDFGNFGNFLPTLVHSLAIQQLRPRKTVVAWPRHAT